jgi:hypothetical protein
MKSSRHEEAESERHKSIVVGILLRPQQAFPEPGKAAARGFTCLFSLFAASCEKLELRQAE